MAEEIDADLQNAIQSETASIQRMLLQQRTESLRRGRRPPLPEDIQELRLQHRIHPLHTVAYNCLWTTTSTHRIDASKVPLETLTRITLQDLSLEKATKGGYLTLRVLENAYKAVGIMTIVEDHAGNAVLFAVYNMTEEVNPNLNDILPIGTVFILKEPYIKISSGNECMLRCDCPSDMIVVYKGHKLFPLVDGIQWRNAIDPNVVDPMFSDPVPITALEWKERGNALFRDKKFEYATRCYLLSLQELTELDKVGDLEQVVLMNASAAYLQRGFYEKSLEFAQKIFEKFPKNKKVLDRAGRCCYKLRKYEVAKKYFDECNTLYPDNEDIKKELKKTNDRLLEQKEGKFDMYKMIETHSVNPNQKIDCADYAGPVKVVKIPGKGRGIVATRDIEPGTLLVVSKALVFNWAPEGNIQIQVNHDNTFDNGSQIINIPHLAQIIAKNPNEFGPIVYDLHDGSLPVRTPSVKLFCNPNTREEPIVDVERIKGILTTNSFSGHNYHVNAVDALQGGGLFILPSYFNHSCIPNASWQIFNDVIFIRTIQSIKANDEVFISYVSWRKPFSERESSFLKRGFQCDCKLCHQESNVPVNIKETREGIKLRYEKIVNQIDGNKRISQDVIRRTVRLVNDLVETYTNSEVTMNETLLFMYILLDRSYSSDIGSSNWKREKQIECNHNILKMFSFDPDAMLKSIENGEKLISSNAFLTSVVLGAIANLVFIHNCAGESDVRNKWSQILCTLENVYSGGDINVVKFNYGFIKNLL